MKPQHYSNAIRGILFIILLLSASPITAKEIRLEMPNKLTGIASYHANDTDKAAVLVLHGFLQTHEFSTIQFIINALVDSDYPVLAPTLSLNTDLRRQSKACDSVHTHNIEDGNLEIKRWIQWLKKQGHQSIVLIGHSSGNLQLISFVQNNTEPAINALIAVSPGTIWNPYKQVQTVDDILDATKTTKTSTDKLSKYSLGFCDNNYMTTAENFLSYSNWTEGRLLKSLQTIGIKTLVITGDNDPYVPDNWAKKLVENNVHIEVIKGANHFYSGEAEFLLQDAIINGLENNK